MPRPIRVGLIGDYDPAVTAHQAIPAALALIGTALDTPVTPHWLPTDAIDSPAEVAGFDALWCVPASPYRSMTGALTGICFAREAGRPFLGTCGGFQHAVIEYARHVLGWHDADHAETNPDAVLPVIAPLDCALIETSASLRLTPGSRLAEAYSGLEAEETHRCRFGLNGALAPRLLGGPLVAAAHDVAGEVRAVELRGHPFFVATLFQPERAALGGEVPPIARALVEAAITARGAALR